MYKVVRYSYKEKDTWDHFVKSSKNAAFLFLRDYMDYHRQRFIDHSLLIYKNNELKALLPANEKGKTIITHEGLTFGGLLLSKDVSLFEVLFYLRNVLFYYSQLGYKELLYKCIPSFYHVLPSVEDRYGFFLLGAQLIRMDMSFVCSSRNITLQKRRIRQIRKAEKNQITIRVDKLDVFWRTILEPNLKQRHGLKPVHSLKEIELLAKNFPLHIVQYNAYYQKDLVAGATMYINEKVAHAQYIASNELGKKMGALDYLFYKLISENYRDKEWFSFGISDTHDGQKMNTGLMEWKEGFGAFALPHYFYRVLTSNYSKLDTFLEQ